MSKGETPAMQSPAITGNSAVHTAVPPSNSRGCSLKKILVPPPPPKKKKKLGKPERNPKKSFDFFEDLKFVYLIWE